MGQVCYLQRLYRESRSTEHKTPPFSHKCNSYKKKISLLYCRIISVYPGHVQACRGENVDPGVSVDETDGYSMSYTIPIQADILVAYSTPEGMYNIFRHNEQNFESLCVRLHNV